MRRWCVVVATVALLGCGAKGPQLAPQQVQAQRTVDNIAQSHSVVRWLQAIEQLLDEFDQLEAGLYAQGIIDGPTHGRIDVLMDLAIVGAIDVLAAIEQEAKVAQATNVYTLKAAPLAATLLERLRAIDGALFGITDPRLLNGINLALSTAQLVLQTLDPTGSVAVKPQPRQVVVPRATPAGVPTTYIPLVGPPPPRFPYRELN